MPKPQVILGVDPGLRHTGYCIIVDGKPKEHGVVVAEGSGKLPVECAIRVVLVGLGPILARWPEVGAAAVEQVQWYGYGRRVTLPLAHVAGTITGYLLAGGIPVYLLLATQRRSISIKRPKPGWEEHDLDALELAILAKRHLDAEAVGDGSVPRALLAVSKRRITVPRNTHG